MFGIAFSIGTCMKACNIKSSGSFEMIEGVPARFQ